MRSATAFDPKNPPKLTHPADYRFFLYLGFTAIYILKALLQGSINPIYLIGGGLIAAFLSTRYFQFIFKRAPHVSSVEWAVQRGYTAMARATYTGLGICNFIIFLIVSYYMFNTEGSNMANMGYICLFFFAEMLIQGTKYDCGVTKEGLLLSSTFAPFKEIAGYRYDSRRAKRVIHHQIWLYKNVNNQPKLMGTFTLRDEQVDPVKALMKQHKIQLLK